MVDDLPIIKKYRRLGLLESSFIDIGDLSKPKYSSWRSKNMARHDHSGATDGIQTGLHSVASVPWCH